MGHLKVGDNLDKEKPEADKGNVFKDDVLNRLNVREPDVYYVNTKIKKCLELSMFYSFLEGGGHTFYTHRGDKQFNIPREGNEHFLFEVVVAIIMWMVRRRRM